MSGHLTLVPRSTLREAFELVRARWPAVIEPGEKTFHLNGGCNMRATNEVHSRIQEWATESEFAANIDGIIGSVEHYVAQSLHSALRDLGCVRPADLDFEAFVSRFDSHPSFKVVPDAQAEARS